ncbi:hypothetical protein [Micromonospora sp. CPCC 206061]|uniref:hypothetical protein n=1 Tax=Micromonospora sp. CPCC 206061 TaxID=3122410 RepID=UPI002FF2292D
MRSHRERGVAAARAALVIAALASPLRVADGTDMQRSEAALTSVSVASGQQRPTPATLIVAKPMDCIVVAVARDVC